MPRPSSVPTILCVDDDSTGLRFRQLILDTTKGEKGTGLGLWVSRSLVEKHGGRLQVRSGPGVGTAFSIFLPASKAAKNEAA